MPKGPKGERRPGDVIGTAVMVGRIATGEVEEKLPKPKKKIVPRVRVTRAKKAAVR